MSTDDITSLIALVRLTDFPACRCVPERQRHDGPIVLQFGSMVRGSARAGARQRSKGSSFQQK
jgi:hypothetical protein